jgi:hypothetical protein
MRRLAISAGIAAALVVTAVAVGAAGDVRVHRLHLPPPPAGDLGSEQPPAGGTTDPTGPGTASPPAPPAPPGAQPPPPPPPPPTVGCSTGSAATPDAVGTLADYTLTLNATTFSSAAPQLTFRGDNVGLVFHSIAIKTPGLTGTMLCTAGTVPIGGSSTFTVTGLAVGNYVIYCTIHPDLMFKDITVN